MDLLINKSGKEILSVYGWLVLSLLSLSIPFIINVVPLSLVFIVWTYLAIGLLFYNRLEALLIFWTVATPFCSWLLRYPSEQAIIGFDRVVIILLVILASYRVVQQKELKVPLQWLEIGIALFTGLVLVDVVLRGSDSSVALKIAIDAFLLPLLLFLVVRNIASFTRLRRGLTIALILLAYLLFAIGAFELVTGVDLLPFPAGQIRYDGVIRPNGPFASDNSYALISLILGLTLIYWRQSALVALERGWQYLYWGAIIAAFAACLIPQFRAVALALVICLAIGHLLTAGWRSLFQKVVIGILLLFLALPAWFFLANTNFYQQRLADPTNAFSRVATYKVAVQIIKDNWLRGVGLNHYEDYFNRHFAPKEMPREKEALKSLPQSTPHNNLLSVTAELGIVGAILYISIFILWLQKAYQFYCQGKIFSAAALTTIVIAYFGVGLTLTSGYYGDLNLYFFFFMGLFIAANNGAEN